MQDDFDALGLLQVSERHWYLLEAFFECNRRQLAASAQKGNYKTKNPGSCYPGWFGDLFTHPAAGGFKPALPWSSL
jgi:hypothetical protein